MLKKVSTKHLVLILGVLVLLFIGIGVLFYNFAYEQKKTVENSTEKNTEDSISSPVVGTLMVYYAKERLKVSDSFGGTHKYEKGGFIFDSRDVCSVKEINNQNYKLDWEDEEYDNTCSYILPKDKIEKKVFQMNQLPVAVIGDRKTFVSSDGNSAVIFKSNNNGHKYLLLDGQVDIESTQKYANC